MKLSRRQGAHLTGFIAKRRVRKFHFADVAREPEIARRASSAATRRRRAKEFPPGRCRMKHRAPPHFADLRAEYPVVIGRLSKVA